MQTLPYIVVSNPHFSHVYELYYRAFERFRRISEIRTIGDNDKFCNAIKNTLTEHLTVIPRLAMGVLEVQNYMRPEATDKFVTTMLRSVGYQISLFRLHDLNRRFIHVPVLACSAISPSISLDSDETSNEKLHRA